MARLLELNEYLTEFPTVNGIREATLTEAKFMEILEYSVPAYYCREFTVQGFDPLTQGLKKFIKFCTQLECCELTMEKPILKKVSFMEKTVIGKRKGKAAKTEKQVSRICMQYFHLHGENTMHSTTDCFELNHKENKLSNLLQCNAKSAKNTNNAKKRNRMNAER